MAYSVSPRRILRQQRREEEREALDAHPGGLGRSEVAELVQDDQRGEAEEGEQPAHVRTAISSDATARASRSASWSDSKARTGPAGRRSSAVSMTAGMPRKSSRPLRKAWTATSLAALRTHGAVPPAAAASRARRRHGKASVSTGSKVSAPISARSSGAHGDVDALGVVQRVGDRHAHVRVAEVREGGAVAQQDVGVHDRLRVYDDVDPLVRRAEEVMGLDQLEALVHQRGRVDRDLAPHRPRGVLEGLLDAHALEVGAAAAAERAAAGGEHELVDRSRAARRR